MKSKEPPLEVETTEPYNWIIFEKLHDGACVITVKGKNVDGRTYISQVIIKNSVVFDALKEKVEGKS